MKKQLTNTQQNAIDKILNRANKILNPNEEDKAANNHINNSFKTVYLKAPTGSGKTFMMLNLIDQMINKFKDRKFVFIVGSISTANLPKQIYQSFCQDSIYLMNSNLDIELIESPSNQKANYDTIYKIKPVANSVRIMGKSSFGKGTIYYEQSTLKHYLDDIKQAGYILVYFRDEAHIGADGNKKNTVGSFETPIQNAADFILKVTATPQTSDKNSFVVQIEESDLDDDEMQLLKKNKKYNEKLEAGVDYDYIGIVEQACKHFREIKDAYNDSVKEPKLVNINPAMLIQVENMPDKKNKDEEKIIERARIKEKIGRITDILKKNQLSYVIYFGDEKFSSIHQKENWDLYDISNNLSPIDVIIFKVGPATGWNIPRACMLVQLREISSSTLSIQTLGRIKRNPVPENLPHNSIGNDYFIYSSYDYNKSTQEVKAKLRKQFENQQFYIGEIISKSEQPLPEIVLKTYNTKVIEYLNKKFKDDTEWNIDNIKQFFKTHLEEFFSEYENKGYYIVKHISYGDSSLITSNNTISNVLDLELHNLDQRYKYRKKSFLNKSIEEYLNELDSTIRELDLDIKWEDYGFKGLPTKSQISQFFWLFILNKVMPEIVDIFNKVHKQINSEVDYILIDSKSLPRELTINKVDLWKHFTKTNETFAYETDDEKFPLDPGGEETFAKRLLEYLKHTKNKNNIKLWVKNPTNDGINLEYLDEQMQITNSYPDFLVIKDDHHIYIEVKKYLGDINPNKTEKIYNSFEKYVNKRKIQEPNKKATFVIALVNNDTKEIYYGGFSTIDSLNKKLAASTDENSSSHKHDRIKSVQSISFKDLII